MFFSVICPRGRSFFVINQTASYAVGNSEDLTFTKSIVVPQNRGLEGLHTAISTVSRAAE